MKYSSAILVYNKLCWLMEFFTLKWYVVCNLVEHFVSLDFLGHSSIYTLSEICSRLRSLLKFTHHFTGFQKIIAHLDRFTRGQIGLECMVSV